MTQMKDSGVEWIGEIPVDWEVQRIKNILWERKESNNPVRTKKILSLLKDKGVIPYSEKGDIGNKAKEDVSNYRLAYPNDIVLNSMNVIIGSVGLSNYFGAVSPVYYTLSTRFKNDDVRYYNYIFQTNTFQKMLVGYGNGILAHRMRIPMSKLNNIMIMIPGSKQQAEIADFLDEKTSLIDKIIDDTKLSIEKLKVYKQSLITETVTKGLDPNVKMKDSGVEWIGEVSEEFYISKLKFLLLSPLTYGANESGIEFNEKLPRYIRITDIDGNSNLKETGKLSLSSDVAAPYILNDGDILFARSGGTVGKTFLYYSKYGKSAYAGYLIKASVNQDKILPEYLNYYTQSFLYEKWKKQVFIQSTIQNIGADKYSLLPVVISLNLTVQKKVCDYLDEKTSQIDALISDKEALIIHYESYKKSLIYEYVTGKKKVKE